MPSAAELKALDFEPEDYDDDAFEVWPENWPAFQIFTELQTQWRVGLNGRTGLDYCAVFRVLDETPGLTPQQRRQHYDDIRVMELAALAQLNKPAD
jgi:hypothetical protein